MTVSSRVAQLESPRDLRVVERERPRPGPGEIVLNFRATALCHSDLDMYNGLVPNLRFPMVLGHEGTGVVESVGPDVVDLAPGDRVILNPIATCGACDLCLIGLDNCCRKAGVHGREFEGSLAEHQALDQRKAFRLPDNIPLEDGTIVETLATVLHAQERVRIGPNMSVVVLGCGTSGNLHVQLAHLSGADPIIGISRTVWKLELARARGATHVVSTLDEDAAAAVNRITSGRGADVVIESSGSPELLVMAMQLARPGGTILSYGIGTRPLPPVTAFPLYMKELSIIGSRALRARDYPLAVDLASSGKIDVTGLVSRTFPLEAVAEAFEYFESHPQDVARVLVKS
ncbi:MAG: alcohol dehydrogenase catalytic domain-containing protein [Chloroflexi bacterium]|nr:alcohol dehydrogenase catalytic domain-containing protein [Chloroflexota bacterium]